MKLMKEIGFDINFWLLLLNIIYNVIKLLLTLNTFLSKNFFY